MRSDRNAPLSRCKLCRSQYYQNYYAKNPNRRKSVREHASKLRERNKAVVREAMQSGCVDCGIKDIRVLDFDHLRDKSYNVSELANFQSSIERIKDEIAKCEVVCSNCHRIRTHNRRLEKKLNHI